jgi:hypothetical protein
MSYFSSGSSRKSMLWGGLHYTSIELIFPPNAGVMQAHEKAPAAEATGATLHNRTLAGALARRPPPAARRPREPGAWPTGNRKAAFPVLKIARAYNNPAQRAKTARSPILNHFGVGK